MSNFSNGPDSITSLDEGRISEAITLLFPYILLSSITNSVPICPEEPIINILSFICDLIGTNITLYIIYIGIILITIKIENFVSLHYNLLIIHGSEYW